MKNAEFVKEELIFENAVKSAHGNEEDARKKLSEKIISFAKLIRNEYGFRRLNLNEILNLPKNELGYLHREFCQAAKEVFKNRPTVCSIRSI